MQTFPSTATQFEALTAAEPAFENSGLVGPLPDQLGRSAMTLTKVIEP